MEEEDEEFSSTLENRWVRLLDNSDPVRFSFIIKNSLSYLNLDLCEYSKLQNRSRTVSEIASDFVNTEEKCRKLFAPNRSLLYKLHLDIPDGREHSLKGEIPSCSLSEDTNLEHIARMAMSCCYYHGLISNLIKCALNDTDQILKVLRTLLNLPFLRNHLFHVKISLMDKFVKCFFPKNSDPLLFEDFIKYCNIGKWMATYEKPEALTFLLYHACHQERDLEAEGYLMSESLDNCIFRRLFLNVKPILMYTDAPGFTLEAYDMYIYVVSLLKPSLTEDLFNNVEKSLPQERICLILQILLLSLKSSKVHNTGEVLRLLWSSSPEPYITPREVAITLVGDLPVDEIKKMYEFYCTSIGETPSNDVCPRTLKQLSRTYIRRILKENNLWIPEGIRLTGLPKSLQLYLNLEKPDSDIELVYSKAGL